MKKMNKEDVKLNNSMRDVVERYGFYPNRAGFIQCPFHKGDRTASMRIYKDSYYCFGCGATGDIFTFVQNMDNVTFKEAFQILGGTYERTASMRIYKDSYYCFGCGATGDIFTFVQNMDNVTFKEAFQILGGTYEKPTFSSMELMRSRRFPRDWPYIRLRKPRKCGRKTRKRSRKK